MNDTTLPAALLRVRSSEALRGGDPPIVTFQIGRQRYGLPIVVVQEIVRLPALVTVAGAPPTLCGLLNLRGQYLPILDGRALMGEQPKYDLSCQIIVAGRESPALGLLVDHVRDVRTIARRVTHITRPDIAAFLSSVVDDEDGSILLIDLAVLMALTAVQHPSLLP